jgi:hypothetical protein
MSKKGRSKMKRMIGAVLVVGALVALCIPVAVEAADGRGWSPFVGSWSSIDVKDGSFQQLEISGSGTVQFLYYDYGCSACGTDAEGNPLHACVCKGEGTVDGNELSGSMAVLCLTKPSQLLTASSPVALAYNEDDTLTGWWQGDAGQDQVWSRTR